VTSRRLFAGLWRANALLIFAAGILSIGVMSFALVQIYRETTRTRYATQVVNVAGQQVDRASRRVGRFETVEGSPVLRATLTLEQEYGFSSGSKETSSPQNYLYYDPRDGRSWWLLPEFTGLLLSTEQVPARKYDEKVAPVVAFAYELVESDTSGDKRLTGSDRRTIAVSDPIGSRVVRLFRDVDELNGAYLQGDGLLFLYTAAGVLRAAQVHRDTFAITRDAVLEQQKGQQGR
jgi:hypothetical protein